MTVMAQELEVTYRVEVSGWDSNQEFFVEKADLEWSEDVGKVVCLCRPVTAGALLFLRLLHPTSLDRVHPVPYQAEPMEPTVNGQFRLRLVQAKARSREA